MAAAAAVMANWRAIENSMLRPVNSEVPMPISASPGGGSAGSGQQRRAATEEEVRRHRKQRAAGEQAERRDRRAPRRTAQFARIDTKILAHQHVQRRTRRLGDVLGQMLGRRRLHAPCRDRCR